MTKIVIIKGGVGNQLFQYGLYCNFVERGIKVKALDLCSDHNGYELEKYFDVQIEKCSKLYKRLFMALLRLPSNIRRKIIIDRFRYSEEYCALFYNDFWQSKRFFPSERWVKFKTLPINDRNRNVLNEMEQTNSIALHVRRGDYLNAGCSELFTNLCNTDYYKNAIDWISKNVENPHFYIFSNDMDWCRSNICPKTSTYIDWNIGNDSIYDMYLMSKCKYVIMANSTFSFWGAFLNENAKMVIYPAQWYNGFKDDTLDIFTEIWKAM